jgi:lipoate-protein ligase A
MALDETILQSCRSGDAIPTLRLYMWKPPGISIGYFQHIENTVDVNKCRENNVDVVRRITGGRAVLHENEITYSLCALTHQYPELGENINETYRKISFALLESLKALKVFGEWVKPKRERIAIDSTGSINSLQANLIQVTEDSNFSKPCFMSNSRYEITVEGKKLIGSAQRREKNCFIQHGSIPLGKGKISLPDLLSEENNRKKMKEDLESKSTNLEKILKRKIGYEEVISALKRGFGRFFNIEMNEEELTKAELKVAHMLKDKKYLTNEWNFRSRLPRNQQIGP